MKKIETNRLLTVGGLILLLSGCSQESKQVSEQTQAIDQEKGEQKQLIDQKGSELKTTLDQTKKD